MTTYTETLEKACKWASLEFDRLITVKSLRTESRCLSVSYPRFFAMAYMNATGRYSMPQIQRALHLGNHTSVLHGLRRAHGHDGKGVAKTKQPLWAKEQFENMIAKDFPAKVITVETWHREQPEACMHSLAGEGGFDELQ